MQDTRSPYGMIFGDPCIMMGCVHEYGHDGEHEYESTPVDERDLLPASDFFELLDTNHRDK